MKIAMMVRGFIPVPRPDDLVYVIIDLAQTIAQQLAERGHIVDFYAPDGSELRFPVKTSTLGLRPLTSSRSELNNLLKTPDLLTRYMPALWDQYLATEMFRRAEAGEYDLLHFHHPESALSLAPLFPSVPVVYTMHDTLRNWHQEVFKLFPSPNQHCISISDRQRRTAPSLPYAATVYNGVDTDEYAYSDKHEDYLLFVGRIVPDKGVSEAVRIAKRTGQKLIIIGPVLPENRAYFNKLIKPHLSDQIVYLGHKKSEETIPYFQKAKCLLLPLKWEEPFGVTMIEAMSCGTPVVVMRRGSASEVVVDGKTGFICDRLRDLPDAVKKVGRISRRACRDHVLKNFTIKKMADNYEQTFADIIAAHEAASALPLPLRSSLN
jgi:glycosyltransferase involved in cell wall biosynthesis